MEFFNTSKRKINCIYNQPIDSNINNQCLLMLMPIGQEYIRCYRMFYILSRQLANIGYHVIRFNYSGQNDSQTVDFHEISTIDDWLEDILDVVHELRVAFNIDEISVIGMRLGASFALILDSKITYKKMILCSPILNGNKYIDEITCDYKNWLNGSFTVSKNHKGYADIFGFLYSESLIKNIRELFINFPKVINAEEVLILDSAINSEFSKQRTKANKLIELQKLYNDKFWIKSLEDKEKKIIPIEDINTIINWINKK